MDTFTEIDDHVSAENLLQLFLSWFLCVKWRPLHADDPLKMASTNSYSLVSDQVTSDCSSASNEARKAV